MPERGPVQFLLHFLRLRQTPGWKIGLAVALVATLGLLPGEESLYQKAKTGLAQSLRQAAWKHALAGEPQPKPWPWDQSTPAANSVVPRLGLSAAIHCDQDAKTSERISETARKLGGIDARDPHLVSDRAMIVEDADAVGVAGDEGFAEQDRDDRLWEPGAPPPAATPSADCSPLDSSIPGALHLMIEAIQGNWASPTEIERKL
ncbi:hypothetical protein [Methyloceanibacter sp.]|uniref:hypothetical protein n=1 Tax=Methyloceanibacter sp. TaxID=1965321 RepID=UPI003D6CDEC0